VAVIKSTKTDIQNNQIKAQHMQEKSVGWAHLQEGAVGAPHIQDNQIQAKHVAKDWFDKEVIRISRWTGGHFHDSGRYHPRHILARSGGEIPTIFPHQRAYYTRVDRWCHVVVSLFCDQFHFDKRQSIEFALPEQAPLRERDDIFELKTTMFAFDEKENHDMITSLYPKEVDLVSGRVVVSFWGKHRFEPTRTESSSHDDAGRVEVRLELYYATPLQAPA
jgi:hypothetical protein